MDPETARRSYKSFVKSRKTQNAVKNADRILRWLYGSDDKKWIRARDLQEVFVKKTGIMADSTLFRLLRDMEFYGLVEKDSRVEIIGKRCGVKKKPNVYYRITFDLKDLSPKDKERKLGITARRYAELAIAKNLLRERGVNDPDAAIQERLDELFKDLKTELEKSDEDLAQEAKERMKDADLGPGEMLQPWEDLDKEGED